MRTDTQRYQLQFVGGPSDGLLTQVDGPSSPVAEKLNLPPSPIVVRRPGTHCFELKGHYSSVYWLTRKRHIEEDGLPTVHVEYRFLGFEMLDHPASHSPAARRSHAAGQRPWIRATRNLVARLGDKIARWKRATFRSAR
jgi:hypothetical protein